MVQIQYAYAIWLLPDEASLRRWQPLVRELARRFKTRPFAPHATLCSGRWTATVSEWSATVDEIAHRLSPLRSYVDEIGYDDEFFRFFYVRLCSDGWQPAFQVARSALAASHLPAIGPHLSLIYSGGFSEIDRHQLSTEYSRQLPACVAFDRLGLVTPNHDDWHDVAQWRITHVTSLQGRADRS